MTYSQHPLDNKLLLGRYRVMRLLGEGGMGTVHLARVEGAEGFTRPVVVKRMKRDIRVTDEGNRLFIREAKILSKLRHPGIVGIIDFGVEDGAHIMVLEYVHGYTLSPWLDYRQRQEFPLPVDICIYIVRRVLEALHYAHNFGSAEGQKIEIVHRDVSPDNILLSAQGYVQLLDFGIASMRGPAGEGATKSGAFRGKLCYAAPETVKAEPATPRSDQYSAAVVLLESITGKTPFETDSIAETFVRMVNEVPAPASQSRPEVSSGLDAVIARALAKDPTERFESALAFSRALRPFQGDDDEVAEKLKALVTVEFERLPELGVEPLKDREAALEKILSIAPSQDVEPPSAKLLQQRALRPAHAPTMIDVDGRSSLVRVDVPPNVLPALPPQTGQGQLKGLLWGLIVVGGLIALGLGAAVALLSRNGGIDPVVVVGDNLKPSQGNTGAGADVVPTAAPIAGSENPQNNGLPSLASAGVGTGQAGAQDPAPAGGTPPQNGSTAMAAKPPAVNGPQKLTGAVQQQSSAFQACFSQSMSDANQPTEAVIHFSVAKTGGAAQVKVEPPSLATTALGSCLLSAAARVRFPELDEPVSFRVPVRARISRTKGSE